MSKALVIGGNSGIGLALVNKLLKENYDHVYIIGKDEPDVEAIKELKKYFIEKTSFYKFNLISDNLDILNKINDIDTLIITAGFGRVSLLENLTEREISNLLKVNFDSCVKIIKHYYDQIKSDNTFYTAIMVSIAGRIVSPFFSVYGATKAGLRFLIENINCELKEGGVKNRILEVSPGSLDGTNFNGQGNDLSKLESITQAIFDNMKDRQTLYIPNYEQTYKEVIQRYNTNPEEFGEDSYKYKLASGRIANKEQVIVGYLSGTFDLFHIGHLNLLKKAKEECDYLIVSVHESGAWKGKTTFIPYEERCEIVKAVKYVDQVVEDFKEDSDAWDKYKYDKLFVGSDYKGTERFNRYEEILKGKANIIYFPYTQGTSSTQLRKKIIEDDE